MNVLIVGAGALGKSLAGMLTSHSSVKILERDHQTNQELLHGKIRIKENNRSRTVKIETVRNSLGLADMPIDLLILATKVKDLSAAAVQSARLRPKYVLLPQNGLFPLAPFEKILKNSCVCRGVTTMACREEGPDQVSVFYRGQMYLAERKSLPIARLFRKCGMPSTVCQNKNSAVWSKLIFSAVMNPLPVLTNKSYEVLRTDDAIWAHVRRAVDEGRAVAKALKIRLAFDPMRLIQRVRNGDLAGIPHRGSIISDVLCNRSTEIESISGELIRQAQSLGIKTPSLAWIFNQAKSKGA